MDTGILALRPAIVADHLDTTERGDAVPVRGVNCRLLRRSRRGGASQAWEPSPRARNSAMVPYPTFTACVVLPFPFLAPRHPLSARPARDGWRTERTQRDGRGAGAEEGRDAGKDAVRARRCGRCRDLCGGRSTAVDRRQRTGPGDRRCSPTPRPIGSRRRRNRSERVRGIDRSVADDAFVAGDRRRRQRRAVRIHRRALRRAVAGADVGQQLERRRILRDGGRRRRRDRLASSRSADVGRRRDGQSGGAHVDVRRRPGRPVRHRRQRRLRHRIR